jgi:hypothetical protein
LTIHCKSFEEMRQFLRGCRGSVMKRYSENAIIGSPQKSSRNAEPVIAKIFLSGHGAS